MLLILLANKTLQDKMETVVLGNGPIKTIDATHRLIKDFTLNPTIDSILKFEVQFQPPKMLIAQAPCTASSARDCLLYLSPLALQLTKVVQHFIEDGKYGTTVLSSAILLRLALLLPAVYASID
jgi:hypothetical protein